MFSDINEAGLADNLDRLERFDALLRRLTHVEEPAAHNKLEIYLVRRHVGLRDFWPNISSNVAGFYSASAHRIIAVASDREAGMNSQEVLFHEYAHHFMFQYFTNVYPAWFVEGFAEFVQTVDFDADSAVVGRFNEGRAYALLRMPWLSIERMLAPAAGERRTDDEAQAFYAQSWLMTHYIFADDNRRRAFASYLTALNSGGDPVAAFEPAFGMSPGEFQARLRRSTGGAIQAFQVVSPRGAATLTMSRLSAAADDLLPLSVRMRANVAAPERAALAERAMTLAAAFASDPLAQRVLAQAEILRGHPQAARAALGPLIEAGSTDATALYLAGASYLTEAQAGAPENWTATITQARRYFARVFRIDPTNVATLYDYVRSYSREQLSPQVLDVLVEAHLQAPQAGEIAVMAGEALMRAERFDEAISTLTLIAYYPHAGRIGAHALTLLQAAQRHQQPPVQTVTESEEE